MGAGPAAFWLVLDVLISIGLVLNVGVNLRTGIKSEGVVVMEPRAIFLSYLHGWMLVDLLSALPYPQAVHGLGAYDLGDEDEQYVRLLVRLPKLLLRCGQGL